MTSDYYIKDNADIEGQKLNAAKGLYQGGDYRGALRLYLDMLNSDYTYKLCYEIGRCYYKLNDFDNAEQYFTRSVKMENIKNPSFMFLGNICHKKNNISKAIEYWITSYSYKPDDETVCLNLASSYFSKDMKFYALYFYEKYLKYAKDKTSDSYLETKNSITEFITIGNDFYRKALRAIDADDNATAIQALEYAVKNIPTNFDINSLLGELYYKEKMYPDALKYLKQAYCLDSKSNDILKKLYSTMVQTGNISGSFCCIKRMLPLVIGNQKEYLEIIKTSKDIQLKLDKAYCAKHIELAKKYYDNNNYHLALFEYENYVLLDNNLSYEYDDIIQKIKSFLHPEERIIKTCFEKGSFYRSGKDYIKSNKYFSKIMTLSDENSSDYKLAKSRIVNV